MKETTVKAREHTVVSVSNKELTSKCDKGNEHHHTVSKDAKVTCDGKVSKLADLKSGTAIRLTTSKDDPKKVISIESGKPVASKLP